MREIGCCAFVLILNRHNPKIYEQSLECVLIGYDSKSRLYRCYNWESKQVYSSYHVKFLESHHSSLTPPASPSAHASPPSIPNTSLTIFEPVPTIPNDLLPLPPVPIPNDLPVCPSLDDECFGTLKKTVV